MIALLDQLGLWMIDYYFAATCLLACATIPLIILRQPAARLVIAWLTVGGLYLLAATISLPNWGRVSLFDADRLSDATMSRPDLDGPTVPSFALIPQQEPPKMAPVTAGIFLESADNLEARQEPDSRTMASKEPPRRGPMRLAVESLPVAWIAALFAVGGATAWAWLVIGALRARRLCRRAQPAPAFIREVLGNSALKLPGELRVLITTEIDSPAALGIWQPTIVLPKWIVEDPASAGMRAALIHEYAHLHARHLWLLAAVRWLLPILYAHPLYWWLRRTISIDQELLADAFTAETCGRREYAENLLDWAKRLARPQPRLAGAIGIWQQPGQVARRLKTLLAESIVVRPRCTRSYRGVVTALALVLVMVLSAVTIRPQTTAKADPPTATPPAAEPPGDQSSPKSASETPLTISGVCLDENRKPLAAARVIVFELLFRTPEDVQQRQVAETKSNDRGEFTLSHSNRDGAEPQSPHLRVIALASGKATASTSIDRNTIAHKPVELVLPPAASLRGRVTDPEGKPIQGATVSAGSCLIVPVPGIGCGVSDADGRFEIADLRNWDSAAEKARPVPGHPGLSMIAGPCTLMVQHPDFARRPAPYAKVPGTVDVVLEKPAIVSGRAILAESNLPAAGVRLEFSSDKISPDHWTRSTTDERGDYRLATLPPGKYKLQARLTGRPVLWDFNVVLRSGANTLDLRMDRGGIIRGRVIDVTTKQPITGGRLSISRSHRYQGTWRSMDGVSVDADGTFQLLVQPGRSHLGMYLGPTWRGVNTDRLLEEGVEVADGETVDVEVRLRPKDNRISQVSLPEDLQLRSEQAAVAAIKSLGGWIMTEVIDGRERVYSVNMVYHETEEEGRIENHLLSDEALFYVRKFPHLRQLYLKSTQATDAGLANLTGLEQLETLMMWDASAVTDAGVANLAALRNLKNVHISNAQLTDESLRLLNQCPRLESISLQGNHFTDRGLEHIRDKTALTRLAIGLGQCEVTDAGLQQIAGLTNLVQLDLQGSKVTDAGLKHLLGMKQLKDLWATSTAVTREGIVELRKSLPRLKGTYNGWQPRDDYPDDE